MSGFFSTLKSIVTSGSGSYEQPNYTVINKTEQHEERRYDACKWVTTSAESMVYKDTSGASFWKLFGYISGKNSASTKIPMTSPVVTFVEPGDGPNCESKFTMAFYLPAAFQDSPPTPTDPDVSIEERPAGTVFARIHGGFTDDKTIEKERQQLLAQLSGAQRVLLKRNGEAYYRVGYDSPFKLFGRRNEVWLVHDV